MIARRQGAWKQMHELFDVYPELSERIGALCGGASWHVTGASALVHDGDAFYFELTKPKHWLRRNDGSTVLGIGGSIEEGETILGCLCREAKEELNVEIDIESAGETYLVYEQQVAGSIALDERAIPRPVLVTISENLYRRRLHPAHDVLAIATFLAEVRGALAPDDLFGLLVVPRGACDAVFGPDEVSVRDACRVQGVHITTREPLPPNAVLAPVWTGRSFQLLLRAGYLP